MDLKILGTFQRLWLRITHIPHGRILGFFLVLFMFLGLLNRSALLDVRPLHHDESIHATFSLDWFENPEEKYYKYDPVYHGPVLYSLVAVAYQVLGPDVWSARSIPLLFGVLLIFSPIFFWRYLGLYGTAASILLVSLSPLLNYYSRFLIHDGLCLFLMALSASSGLYLYSAYRRAKPGKDHSSAMAIVFGVSTGVLTAAKLVGVIHIIFLAFFFLMSHFVVQNKKKIISNAKFNRTKVTRIIFISGFLSFAFFVSSLGSNLSVLSLESIAKTFGHWWSQHQVQRLVGPTIFHLRSMLIHELFCCAIVMFAGIQELSKSNLGKRFVKWLCVTLVVSLVALYFKVNVKDVFPLFSPLMNSAKIVEFCDIFVYLLSLVCGIYLPIQFLSVRKFGLAFLWYWTFANLAAFSFIGEKVPWLTLYTAYSTVLLAGYYFGRFAHTFLQSSKISWTISRSFKALVLVLSLIFTISTSYVVCHVTEGKKIDLLSQVHNSTHVLSIWDQMKKIASLKPNGRIKVAISGEPVWSFYFYIRTEKFVDLVLELKEPDDSFDVMIFGKEHFTDEIQNKTRALGYSVENYELAWWFVPEFGEMGFGRWMQYALFRDVTDGTGYREMAVAINKLNSPVIQENQE